MSEAGEQPGPSGSGQTPSERGGKLFLGGLSWDTSEDKLRDHFGRYGDLLEVVVMRDKASARPRGFGFVTYTDPEVADRVVQDVHIVDGRQIDAKKSVPQEQKPKARKIFVGGLSPDTTEEEFRVYFGRFGEVAEVQIMQDHMTGRSRGFGFVTFEEDSSAERVFGSGAMHNLGGKQVEVKPATPKGSGSQRGAPRAPHAGEYPGGGPLPSPFVPGLPGTPPYGVAYGMYGGFGGGRAPVVPGPFPPGPGYQPYTQYPGMQYQGLPPGYQPYQQFAAMPQQLAPQQMQGYPAAGYAAYMSPYGEPGRQLGGGGAVGGGGDAGTPAFHFALQHRPGPSPQAATHQSLSPPYHPRQRSGGGRGGSKVEVPQVDSASSLELGERDFGKLRLD